MSLLKLTMVTITAALLSSASFARDCTAPAAPDIPKGKDTNTTEMMNARAEFSEYLAQSRQYLACVKDKQMKLAKDATEDEREAVDELYDSMVSNMQTAYEDMGRAAKQFKQTAEAKMDEADAATQSEQDAVARLYKDMVTKLKAASNEVKRAYNDFQEDVEEAE
ncbi:MAG TPA: hypothetical protein DIW43_15790 [Spongiibacteraceae bacterium]|nr:hypothetical protein [Spongiibacteraceae bacterium]HCS28920.1 hypothetical protein [Spongiibacteraceae bacterium]